MRLLADTDAYQEILNSRCRECGQPLGSRNKSGYCRRHHLQRVQRIAVQKQQERAPYVTKVCPVCEMDFECPPSHAMRRKCCSRECLREHSHRRAVQSYPPKDEVLRLLVDERMTDRELGRRFGRSYQWALGVRRHYGIWVRGRGEPSKPPKGDRSRWAISLKREDGCRNCGSEGHLALHHAVPRSLAPAGKYDLRNGIPLCTRCHLGWHNRDVALHRDLFTPEEWEFIQTLIGPVWLDERYPEPTDEAPF